MNCPGCGASIDDDSMICPECDHIIDGSFLEDDVGGDGEDTDPGAEMAEMDDPGTDPGGADSGAADHTEVGPAPKAPVRRAAGQGMPEAPPPTRPAPPRPSAIPRPAARPAPKPQPKQETPAEAEEKRGLRGALEFDTSSQLMDDYGKLATDTWQRFLALPATEKVGVVGILLALVAVLLPWWTTVSPAGLADDHFGLEGIGLVSGLLAAGGLGLVWYRLSSEPAAGRTLVLAQVAISGLGALVGVMSFLSSLALKAPAMNPHHIRPGPSFGVVFALGAWSVALIGAVVALKDAGGKR